MPASTEPIRATPRVNIPGDGARRTDAPARSWNSWVLRILLASVRSAVAGRLRAARVRRAADGGGSLAASATPPARSLAFAMPLARAAQDSSPAVIVAPPDSDVGSPGLLTPSAGLATPSPDPLVGADGATGLIPDHGARHLPRALWLVLYALALAGPFVLIEIRDNAEPRPFIYELGSALGIAALSLLALQLVLPARLPLLSALGAEVAVRLHRRLADIMLAVVAAHVAAVMVADPTRLQLLGFFGEPWRAQAAIGSVVALAVLLATSFIRRRVRLSYVRWRAIHLLLGALALVLAVVHTVGVGRYLVTGPAEWALVSLTVAGLGALVVMRSRHLRRGSIRPYVVERVVAETGGAVTLALRADGHAGQRFIPGQFAWLKLADQRVSLAEHPFSYASSAESPSRPSFTMKIQRVSALAPRSSRPEPASWWMGPTGRSGPEPRPPAPCSSPVGSGSRPR